MDNNNCFEYEIDSFILDELLKDRNSNKNIIFATNNYESKGYKSTDQISSVIMLNRKRKLIKPRIEKSKREQQVRSKDKAEVFTPSWVCNKQNNLIDEAWFSKKSPFNIETEKGWETKTEKVDFSNLDKSWQDYVLDIRLEITCGEAPYLTSRYDTVIGQYIDVENRIGLLDRKLRVINENLDLEDEWFSWVKKAYQSIYGYEYQGDNLLIARENLLFTFYDNYKFKFGKLPDKDKILEIIFILTWNIFQMDGLKYVIPESCHNSGKPKSAKINLFGGEEAEEVEICKGCQTNDPYHHNGKYCYIMDWEKNKRVKFLSLLKGVI